MDRVLLRNGARYHSHSIGWLVGWVVLRLGRWIRILVSNEPTLAFTSVATRTIPIVFANVTLEDLARHYDNVTGIIAIEPVVAEKWVSALKDLVPRIERMGFLCASPSLPKVFLQRVEETTASRGVKLVPMVALGGQRSTRRSRSLPPSRMAVWW